MACRTVRGALFPDEPDDKTAISLVVPVCGSSDDRETLGCFLGDVDRPSGMPSLAAIVMGGKAIPNEDSFSQSIKTLAQAVPQAGPPEWD
jgi:hypothetical protein